ncbi:MAG: DNA-binding transcriptional regulator [bacterium]
MKKRKRNVLLAITTTHHGLYRGVAKFAREHNWHLTTDMLYAATIPQGWKGDGIVSHVGYWNELADFIRANPVPRVELTSVRKDLGIPFVEGDNRAIGVLAARHFLTRGYRHFAWFPFTNDPINEERREGFSETIAKEGHRLVVLPTLHELRNFTWRGNWSRNLSKIGDALAALPKPCAVFCYNDCAAATILSTCQEVGIPVPEQVAIAGVDNDELLCESVQVPLTSVMHDLEGVGYHGAALLERLMNREQVAHESPRIPPKGIMMRQSTDMLAVENVEVARALRHIWENYSDSNLQVSSVVEATRISRRPLEIAFKREVGRTINHEIARIRIDKVKDLLLRTEMSVREITEATGFTRPNHLHRVFKHHAGLSPRDYQTRVAGSTH